MSACRCSTAISLGPEGTPRKSAFSKRSRSFATRKTRFCATCARRGRARAPALSSQIDVPTAALLRAAPAQALDLANGRYQYQLASIVELTTAQLDETSAEIDNLNAKYDYEIQYALLRVPLPGSCVRPSATSESAQPGDSWCDPARFHWMRQERTLRRRKNPNDPPQCPGPPRRFDHAGGAGAGSGPDWIPPCLGCRGVGPRREV